MQGVAQLVGDGVLDFERAELGVADALADAVEVHGEGAVGVNVFVPRHRAGEGVDVVGVGDFAFGDDPEDSAGDARPEAEAVGGFEVARAGDNGDAEAGVLQAEGFSFGEQDLFAAFGAGKDEGVLHRVPCVSSRVGRDPPLCFFWRSKFFMSAMNGRPTAMTIGHRRHTG